MNKFIWVFVLTLAGCSETESEPTRFPSSDPAEDASGSPEKTSKAAAATDSGSSNACQSAIEIGQLCYDNSGPDISCQEVLVGVQRAALKADMPPSTQRTIANYCAAMCGARKSNVSWTSVRATLLRQCQ